VGRNDYIYRNVTGVGGINQQADLADPETELLDARNLWAPDGRLVQRPGYVGVGSYGLDFIGASTEALTSVSVVKEDPIGTFVTTTTLDSLPQGSRWYLGFALPTNTATAVGIEVEGQFPNSSATWAAMEYWNGTTWAPLVNTNYNDVAERDYHLGPKSGALASVFVNFAWPGDMAQATVNALTKYWVRFTIGGEDLDASVSVDNAYNLLYWDSSASVKNPPIIVVQFPTYKRYIGSNGYTATDGFRNAAFLGVGFDAGGALVYPATTINASEDFAPTFAVVPQFGEVYLSYNREVTVHKAVPTSSDTLNATVEDDPSFIGTNADWDIDDVAQLSAFPAGKYITFFNSRLWSANLDGSPYEIRWSAPEPAYRVWPTISNAVIMEDDNSPITGLRGFQENLIVTKNDSIWQMVNIGEDINGVDTFKARRMVRGTGCVSNSSMQEVQGHLVFLAEDGIYAWAGGTEVKKLSDKISSTIKRINPARWQFATSVVWKTKSLYLLSVAVDGSGENNLVIVWDYKNNTWWLWDNIKAQNWMYDEDAVDNEQIFFFDASRNILQLGPSQTDHGTAITSYFTSHQVGVEDNYTKRLRRVELKATNNSNSATVEIRSNDEASGSTATLTFTDTAEASWDDFVYSDDDWTPQRDRTKAAGYLKAGEWFTAKVTHSTKNTPFEMEKLVLGFVPVGRR